MDDAEGARTGCDSGVALILRNISLQLYELAARLKAAKGLPILAHDIADQATKIKGLAQFMDDAEGARTGSDSGQGFKRSLDVPVPYTKKKIVCGAGKAKGFARNLMKIQHFSSLQATFILTFFADITIRRILPLADVSHGPSPLILSSATTQSIYADR